jgi:hypothetical protein
MADNQIKISVNLDSKEFDQNFKRIMNQVNQLRQATANVPGLAASGASASSKIGGANQTVNAQQSDRSLQGLQKTLEGLTGRTDTFNKSLSALSKTLDDLSNKAQQAATATGQAATAQQAAGGGGGGAGPTLPGGGAVPGGAGGTLGKILSAAKVLSTVGSAMSAVGGATKFGGQLYSQVTTYPNRIAQREASMSDMMSESARLQQQRRGYETFLFGPERLKAMEGGRRAVKGARAEDMTGLVGGTLAGAGAGMVGGAAIGGALGLGLGTVLAPFTGGASIPLFGAAGAKIGAGYGTAIGGATAFGSQMTNDRKRSMLFDQESYGKEMGAVFAGNYKEQLAAERAKSYQKDLAGQFFEQESGRFRGVQRQFGLSDEELFLGDQSMFRKAGRAGYDMDTMTQSMQGISAAGGTTKTATAGAGIAAQMQRNLDLTNAPQLLGKVSGGTGMNEIQSKDAIIRMYAEATRIGLDTSETRDFLQASADTAYRTGGNLESITGLLSAGVQGTGLQSTKGVDAAQNALERMRQQTSEMGGLTGQYGIAALQGEEVTKALGGEGKALGRDETATILGTPIDQLSDDYLESLLLQRNQKRGPEEIKKLRQTFTKAKTEATTRAPGQEEALKKYYEVTKDPNATRDEKLKAYGDATSIMGAVEGGGFLGLDEVGKKAEMGMKGAALSGAPGAELSDKIEEVKGKYETDRGRMTDKSESQAAMGAAGSLLNLKENADKLVTAFDKVTQAGETAAAKWAELTNLSNIMNEMKNKEAVSGVEKFLTNPKTESTLMSTPADASKVNNSNMGSPSN